MRPKTLKAIKQERLAAKEQIQAAQHAMQHVGLDLDDCLPRTPLRQVAQGEQRVIHEVDGVKMAFLVDSEGASTWNLVEPGPHVRLVLNPDQGSALFCGYEWLAQQNMAISLRRDELRHECNQIWSVLHSTVKRSMLFKLKGTSSLLIATAS